MVSAVMLSRVVGVAAMSTPVGEAVTTTSDTDGLAGASAARAVADRARALAPAIRMIFMV